MADADTGSKPVDQGTLMADIDRTRAQLARTIDAISDRMSPKQNARRALDTVRQRVIQIDPVVAGVAAAAVAVSITAVVLLRSRGRRARGRRR